MSIMSGVRVLENNNDMKKILFLIIGIATFFSCSGKSPADDNVYPYQMKMHKYQNESNYVKEIVQEVFYVIEKYKDNRRILFYAYSRPNATYRERHLSGIFHRFPNCKFDPKIPSGVFWRQIGQSGYL